MYAITAEQLEELLKDRARMEKIRAKNRISGMERYHRNREARIKYAKEYYAKKKAAKAAKAAEAAVPVTSGDEGSSDQGAAV